MNKSEPCLRLLSSLEKSALMRPEIIPQEHQQRVADRISGEDPRLLVYHGLGTGKSLASILGAEQSKEDDEDNYGIIAPASLKPNFQKEIDKFTVDSSPEIMSYTAAARGKQFEQPPSTLIVDEAHRLRNPLSASSKAVARNAATAKRLMLLTGSPIVNQPSDLATPISLLTGNMITPKQFEKRYIGTKKVSPGIIGRLRGIPAGEKQIIKNEKELRDLLKGKVDYQPSKTPEGVNVNEETINVEMSPEQERIQNAIRKGLPLKFLWKLDSEFPLSAEESKKLNAFLSGLRQISLSTRSFRADKDPLKAFQQSGKLNRALADLKKTFEEDERRKAIIYSNYVNAGLDPYAAALKVENIPHGVFHGQITEDERKKAIKEYNEGKLRALLIGPAGAEGISTKGTNLIQLLDPHWNEARSSQAKGRGLRFDSHVDLPEDLKDVKIQKYISTSKNPSFVKRLMGHKRPRTGDEIVQLLSKQKEELNERFRKLLQEEGSSDG